MPLELLVFKPDTTRAQAVEALTAVIAAMRRELGRRGGLILVRSGDTAAEVEALTAGVLEEENFRYAKFRSEGEVFWNQFGSETEMEDPRTFGRAATFLDWLADAGAGGESAVLFAAAVWVHPDAHSVPLSRYVRMAEGHLLPGCPRGHSRKGHV